MQGPEASWKVPALVVGAITLLGLAVRVVVFQQDVFADELSTYWIVSTNDLDGVISSVTSDNEISPPLSFAVAWLTTQVDLSPEMLRAGSLAAGVATIPGVYLLGVRTVGRQAGVVASALTALAPFMVYYSSEARGYALMMAFVLGSTLAMLRAVDDGRIRWWVVYAICSCAAVYTHYTSVFVLGVQLVWLLWTHTEARRAALLANVGAAVAFIPWLPGLRDDFESPTTDILSALLPFTEERVRVSLGHWTIGYPYDTIVSLSDVPGITSLVLLAIATALAAIGLLLHRSQLRERLGSAAGDHRTLLVVGLALATPVGAALFSAVGSTTLFGTRNLAASWPALALAFATALVSCGPRLRVAATALAILAFALGGAKMLQERFHRPDYEAAAQYVEDRVQPGDVIIDETGVLSPGPLSHLDAVLGSNQRVFRSRAPQQDDHPFNIFDRVVSPAEATRKALAAAHGRRIFVVTGDRHGKRTPPRPMGRYRLAASRTYPGILDTTVQVYTDGSAPAG
jgi:hypothetical protein